MNNQSLLSVIVPAYNQEKTIQKDLQNIYSTLQQIRLPFELIVVVDGQTDSTHSKVKNFASSKSEAHSYLLKQNQGKGQTVRYGFKKAKGDYIAFIDAGMEINPNGLSLALEHLQWYQADIIVGSKRHLASQVNYPPLRHILSFFYHRLVKLLFGFKVSDTQAGLKIFKKEVLKKVLPRLLVKHYAFDVEILAVAHHLGFNRIYEAPIKLDFQFESLTSAATLDTIWRMLIDTAAVFYRLHILHYYN